MVSREEIELLLKVQREAFSETVNHLVRDFNLQKAALESKIQDFTNQLENLRREDQNKQTVISILSAKLDELEVAVEGNKFDSKPIHKRLDSLEDFSRRNNLRFDGIEEKNGENWEQVTETVRKIVKEKIGVTGDIEIERAHRVGLRNSTKPRTIVAKFLKFTHRQEILRNSFKLKGSQIFINEDLCETSINKRKEQLEELREAKKAGKTAYFVHTRLVVRDKFSPDTTNTILRTQAGKKDPIKPRTAPQTSAFGTISTSLIPQKEKSQVTTRSAVRPKDK